MQYKILLIAYFASEQPLAAVKDALLSVWGQAVNANKEERTHVEVEKCYHDETPTQPCVKIFEKTKGEWHELLRDS